MKKRILALALAGTTAFSVFGGAMSANAADIVTYIGLGNGTTHIEAEDNAYYRSYTPAGTIRWGSGQVADKVHTVDNSVYTVAGVSANASGHYPKGTVLYVTPDVYNRMAAANDSDLSYVTVMTDAKSGVDYYASETAFANANGYQLVSASGATTTPASFTYGGSTWYIVKHKGSSGSNATFHVVKGTYDSNAGSWSYPTGYNQFEPVSSGRTYYISTSGLDAYTSPFEIKLQSEVIAEVEGTGSAEKPYYIEGSVNNLTYHDYTTPTTVITTDGYTVNSVTTDAGYTTMAFVDPTDADAVLSTPVASSGVIYLYDYYDNMPTSMDADDIAQYWSDGSFGDRMTAAGLTSIAPVLSYRGRGVRQEVMYAWEDFLDNLGISDASNAGLTQWATQTIKNYAWTYYNADAVNVTVDWSTWNTTQEVSISYGADVNLYNFNQLIADILELAPADHAANAQTSELVYLMQQYDKYVGEGFVTEIGVDTDDWGDLLVALAEAPTREDFTTDSAYNRYVNKVEDLVEQYEEAETHVAVGMAEIKLYEFVTSYNSAYTVTRDSKLDSSALAGALDSTYFNANWAAIGENYAGGDTDGILAGNKSISEYSYAWALYPSQDYSGGNTTAYPGVDTAYAYVNDSYHWFYNVYDLAYNVYVGNRYQSVVDLMATSLEEAIDNLVPTTNSTASDILAAEEEADKLVDLIESDYTTAMWANRNKAYNHITDRVSNDEIGRQGTHIVEMAARETAYLMGWQKFQTAVTRSEINSVKVAKANAQAALTALRNDEDKYNAAQANALEKAIEDCDYIIDIYEGTYSKSKSTQSLNTEYSALTGDKDQILKSDITDALEAVDSAINFSNVIQGWSQNSDGEWMYGTTEGYLNDGWHQVDGGNTWFYFNEDDTAKQSEWMQENGNWYWFNSNCGAAVGWAKVDGDWYYFKGNNAMRTGWEKVDGNWYYMASSGKMVTGWCQVNGTWYYFSKESNSLGQMLYSTTTPDGYKVDANGALVD